MVTRSEVIREFVDLCYRKVDDADPDWDDDYEQVTLIKPRGETNE